jgi:hypothetical protein
MQARLDLGLASHPVHGASDAPKGRHLYPFHWVDRPARLLASRPDTANAWPVVVARLHMHLGPRRTRRPAFGASDGPGKRRRVQPPGGHGWIPMSHLHGDHFGGLPFLVVDGQFTNRTRPLQVAGPTRVRQRVQAAMEVLFPGSTQVRRRFAVHFHELADRQPRRSSLRGWCWSPLRSCMPRVRRRWRCRWPGRATPSPTPGTPNRPRRSSRRPTGSTC